MQEFYWSQHAGFARDWPPERICDLVARAGYAGVEIWVDPKWLDRRDPADIKRIKGEAAARGLATPSVSWRQIPGLEPTDPAVAPAAREYLLDCVRVAEACGAPTVLIWMRVPEGVAYEVAYASARDVIGSLEAECRTRGVRIAIEFESPFPRVLLGTPEQTLTFIAETGRHVAACADTFHLFNRGIEQRAGVVQLAGHLAMAHLRDSDTQMPGKGAVDFPAFFRGLSDIGYPGPVFMQFDPDSEDEVFTALRNAREYARIGGWPSTHSIRT
jgi:sugar phosphate isomerase/epimerase